MCLYMCSLAIIVVDYELINNQSIIVNQLIIPCYSTKTTFAKCSQSFSIDITEFLLLSFKYEPKGVKCYIEDAKCKNMYESIFKFCFSFKGAGI